ncbi:hypothetical protein DFH08DRAFT_813708 [Mycena albidolilacea]|uniref:Uncharacterized protein n=1 Tax=Mycena albidolilacea TaxID=1033008 RepID=A0AAD6ZQQ0_9AGAR|nr:hypothetical protein DFH08DRAFT_813708 [Mycena albidolilacea]
MGPQFLASAYHKVVVFCKNYIQLMELEKTELEKWDQYMLRHQLRKTELYLKIHAKCSFYKTGLQDVRKQGKKESSTYCSNKEILKRLVAELQHSTGETGSPLIYATSAKSPNAVHMATPEALLFWAAQSPTRVGVLIQRSTVAQTEPMGIEGDSCDLEQGAEGSGEAQRRVARFTRPVDSLRARRALPSSRASLYGYACGSDAFSLPDPFLQWHIKMLEDGRHWHLHVPNVGESLKQRPIRGGQIVYAELVEQRVSSAISGNDLGAHVGICAIVCDFESETGNESGNEIGNKNKNENSGQHRTNVNPTFAGGAGVLTLNTKTKTHVSNSLWISYREEE